MMSGLRLSISTFYVPRGAARSQSHSSPLSCLCAIAILAALSAGAAHAVTVAGVQNTAPNAQALVNAILGAGITLVPGSITLTGVDNQQGTFTNGAGSIGIANGIVLTSGNANDLNGDNAGAFSETLGLGDGTNAWSQDLGTGGDAALDALAGFPTFDANLLTFSFQFGDGSTGGNLFFNFVFASEEYVDFVGTEFNDVFAFLVDGVNVALIGGNPITINNINPNVNSAFYINNVANTNGFPNANRAVTADGFTTVLTAQRLGLGPGQHTMSFRIADTSDGILDAAVFIQGGSFSTDNPIPEPATGVLMIAASVVLAIRRRLMDKLRGPVLGQREIS